MDDFLSRHLFVVIVTGLLKLLIAVNRRHWQQEAQEKLAIVMELFDGDKAAAQVWVSTRVKSLSQRRPRDVMTEETRIVADRISHGVIT
jgi:uncharacterized protein (DUF2384 family)